MKCFECGSEAEHQHHVVPKSMTAHEKWDKSHFLVSQIKTAYENNRLYDRFGIANADDHALALSIQSKGIQEPLVLSADNYLLSGHRRMAAAK